MINYQNVISEFTLFVENYIAQNKLKNTKSIKAVIGSLTTSDKRLKEAVSIFNTKANQLIKEANLDANQLVKIKIDIKNIVQNRVKAMVI